jgi:hypothetical protein
VGVATVLDNAGNAGTILAVLRQPPTLMWETDIADLYLPVLSPVQKTRASVTPVLNSASVLWEAEAKEETNGLNSTEYAVESKYASRQKLDLFASCELVSSTLQDTI